MAAKSTNALTFGFRKDDTLRTKTGRCDSKLQRTGNNDRCWHKYQNLGTLYTCTWTPTNKMVDEIFDPQLSCVLHVSCRTLQTRVDTQNGSNCPLSVSRTSFRTFTPPSAHKSLHSLFGNTRSWLI